LNVFFAGGGTGGHLYPALAIARALVAADSRVRPFFIGAQRGIEREILPTTEFPFELFALHPLYRSQPWLNWRTAAGSIGSWRRISQIAASSNPRVLVATGGYAAGVALAVAAVRRIPIVIQEQNSFPGVTVRRFAPRAAQLHLGFPEAEALLRVGPRTRVFRSGNPIEAPPTESQRPSRAAAARKFGFDGAAPTLLISGGSQGSAGINEAVSDWLAAGPPPVRVIWATGRSHHQLHAHLESDSVRVIPFISPMSDAYCAADLALTRAGAMTTAELSAWGIPAILVPLPTAAADHQTANAKTLAGAGAAVMIRQDALTPGLLAATVARLINDSAVLSEMRENTLIRARPLAAQDIATHILEMDSFK
jgi:UDP-N-acetylglucosamine--N-acetylmuramyl-(pentapeptide) pyrophosphoryl-undecaprenol N-acetylglucosamine transferase